MTLRIALAEDILSMDENLEIKEVCEHIDKNIMGLELLIEQMDNLAWEILQEIIN